LKHSRYDEKNYPPQHQALRIYATKIGWAGGKIDALNNFQVKGSRVDLKMKAPPLFYINLSSQITINTLI
jgi:hypothetical protein